MSLDNTTVENLRAICLDHAKLGENSLSPTLDSCFFGPSPSQVLYLTEVYMQFNSVFSVCLYMTVSFMRFLYLWLKNLNGYLIQRKDFTVCC